MIPRETVDLITSTAKIEEVVGDYITLRRRGGNYVGLCPFHDERTPSFNVNPARNIFKCFGCSKAGSAVKFVMEIESCSYPEALKKIAQRYNIPVVEEDLTPDQIQRQDDRESMSAANTWAMQWFEDQLWNTQEGQAVGLSYFHQRGLRDDIIRLFHLGYSPAASTAMAQAAEQQGFTERYLTNDLDSGIGTGLLCQSSRDGRLFDRYHDRVIFPFLSTSGKVDGFAGRLLREQENVGKYVNSPDSLLFNKSRELFGIYQARQEITRKDMAYLVEGQMDVISMHQAGIRNTICSGGTALTEGHIRILHRITDNVTILYDGDKAGIKAAIRAIDMFHMERMKVRVMLFPDGDDPDSFARRHTAEEFVNYINEHAEDFIHFQKRLLYDTATDSTQRLSNLQNIIHSIAIINEVVDREYYTRELASLVQMSFDSLAQSVDNARKNIIAEWRRQREEQERMEARRANNAGEVSADTIGAEETDRNQAPSNSEQTSQPTQQQASRPRDAQEERIAQHFYNITQMIVRHGNQKYCDNNDGTFLPVGYFIIDDLRRDGISSVNPLFEKIFDEYLAHFCDPNFSPDTFFLNHPDQELSAVAADMMSDPYYLSREVGNTDYPKQAMRLLCELKVAICDRFLSNLNQQIRLLPTDSPELPALQEQLRDILASRTDIANRLRRL